MKFQFFESLTSDEAEAFLRKFLSVECDAVEAMIAVAAQEGVHADFTVASILPVLRWILGQLETIPRRADESLPWWIRESDSYVRGLFDFNAPSRVLIMRAAFYLGESFVREYRSLSWATGNVETAEQNMPVVTGFRFGIEMAPILVVENLFSKIIADGEPIDVIARAVDGWKSHVS